MPLLAQPQILRDGVLYFAVRAFSIVFCYPVFMATSFGFLLIGIFTLKTCPWPEHSATDVTTRKAPSDYRGGAILGNCILSRPHLCQRLGSVSPQHRRFGSAVINLVWQCRSLAFCTVHTSHAVGCGVPLWVYGWLWDVNWHDFLFVVFQPHPATSAPTGFSFKLFSNLTASRSIWL